MVNVGDFVVAEYDNGTIVNGEVVKVKNLNDRILATVKAEQGYRSIYLDKCVTLEFSVTHYARRIGLMS